MKPRARRARIVGPVGTRRCYSLPPCGKQDCYLCWPKKVLEMARDAKREKARARVIAAAIRWVNDAYVCMGDGMGRGRNCVFRTCKHHALARAVAVLRKLEAKKL